MTQVWSSADLHLHTTWSDGHNTPEEVLAHVAQHTSLRLIAITDHDTIDGALAARRLAPAYGIDVIIGEEVSTADGHLLVLFIERALPPGRPAAETIAAAHAQGGICIAAHPYDWMVPSLGRSGLRQRASGPVPEWPLDAVETFNASLWSPRMNALAAADARALHLAAVGGSDAHHLATIGTGVTSFPGTTADDLRAALLARRTEAAGRAWGFAQTAIVTGLVIRREWRAFWRRGLRRERMRSA